MQTFDEMLSELSRKNTSFRHYPFKKADRYGRKSTNQEVYFQNQAIVPGKLYDAIKGALNRRFPRSVLGYSRENFAEGEIPGYQRYLSVEGGTTNDPKLAKLHPISGKPLAPDEVYYDKEGKIHIPPLNRMSGEEKDLAKKATREEKEALRLAYESGDQNKVNRVKSENLKAQTERVNKDRIKVSEMFLAQYKAEELVKKQIEDIEKALSEKTDKEKSAIAGKWSLFDDIDMDPLIRDALVHGDLEYNPSQDKIFPVYITRDEFSKAIAEEIVNREELTEKNLAHLYKMPRERAVENDRARHETSMYYWTRMKDMGESTKPGFSREEFKKMNEDFKRRLQLGTEAAENLYEYSDQYYQWAEDVLAYKQMRDAWLDTGKARLQRAEDEIAEIDRKLAGQKPDAELRKRYNDLKEIVNLGHSKFHQIEARRAYLRDFSELLGNDIPIPVLNEDGSVNDDWVEEAKKVQSAMDLAGNAMNEYLDTFRPDIVGFKVKNFAGNPYKGLGKVAHRYKLGKAYDDVFQDSSGKRYRGIVDDLMSEQEYQTPEGRALHIAKIKAKWGFPMTDMETQLLLEANRQEQLAQSGTSVNTMGTQPEYGSVEATIPGSEITPETYKIRELLTPMGIVNGTLADLNRLKGEFGENNVTDLSELKGDMRTKVLEDYTDERFPNMPLDLYGPSDVDPTKFEFKSPEFNTSTIPSMKVGDVLKIRIPKKFKEKKYKNVSAGEEVTYDQDTGGYKEEDVAKTVTIEKMPDGKVRVVPEKPDRYTFLTTKGFMYQKKDPAKGYSFDVPEGPIEDLTDAIYEKDANKDSRLYTLQIHRFFAKLTEKSWPYFANVINTPESINKLLGEDLTKNVNKIITKDYKNIKVVFKNGYLASSTPIGISKEEKERYKAIPRASYTSLSQIQNEIKKLSDAKKTGGKYELPKKFIKANYKKPEPKIEKPEPPRNFMTQMEAMKAILDQDLAENPRDPVKMIEEYVNMPILQDVFNPESGSYKHWKNAAARAALYSYHPDFKQMDPLALDAVYQVHPKEQVVPKDRDIYRSYVQKYNDMMDKMYRNYMNETYGKRSKYGKMLKTDSKLWMAMPLSWFIDNIVRGEMIREGSPYRRKELYDAYNPFNQFNGRSANSIEGLKNRAIRSVIYYYSPHAYSQVKARNPALYREMREKDQEFMEDNSDLFDPYIIKQLRRAEKRPEHKPLSSKDVDMEKMPSLIPAPVSPKDSGISRVKPKGDLMNPTDKKDLENTYNIFRTEIQDVVEDMAEEATEDGEPIDLHYIKKYIMERPKYKFATYPGDAWYHSAKAKAFRAAFDSVFDKLENNPQMTYDEFQNLQTDKERNAEDLNRLVETVEGWQPRLDRVINTPVERDYTKGRTTPANLDIDLENTWRMQRLAALFNSDYDTIQAAIGNTPDTEEEKAVVDKEKEAAVDLGKETVADAEEKRYPDDDDTEGVKEIPVSNKTVLSPEDIEEHRRKIYNDKKKLDLTPWKPGDEYRDIEISKYTDDVGDWLYDHDNRISHDYEDMSHDEKRDYILNFLFRTGFIPKWYKSKEDLGKGRLGTALLERALDEYAESYKPMRKRYPVTKPSEQNVQIPTPEQKVSTEPKIVSASEIPKISKPAVLNQTNKTYETLSDDEKRMIDSRYSQYQDIAKQMGIDSAYRGGETVAEKKRILSYMKYLDSGNRAEPYVYTPYYYRELARSMNMEDLANKDEKNWTKDDVSRMERLIRLHNDVVEPTADLYPAPRELYGDVAEDEEEQTLGDHFIDTVPRKTDLIEYSPKELDTLHQKGLYYTGQPADDVEPARLADEPAVSENEDIRPIEDSPAIKDPKQSRMDAFLTPETNSDTMDTPEVVPEQVVPEEEQSEPAKKSSDEPEIMSLRDMFDAIRKSDKKEGHPYGKPIEGNVFAYGSTFSEMGEGKDMAMPKEIPAGKVNGEGATSKKIDL